MGSEDSFQSASAEFTDDVDEDLSQFQIRRTWESSPHPYLFFNPDHESMTFIGFKIEKRNRHLIDQQTGRVLEKTIMSSRFYLALTANHVPINETFDMLSREEKINRICRVIGNDTPYDPDYTYELTTDNVKKMMAIYMRFRCDIPVIVMGETGCGKTRLIKFLCALQCPPGVPINTMVIMKVHGGTTKDAIIAKVEKAEMLAQKNCEDYGEHIITVLFFDEANTTEAIGVIKEIMCDCTIDGRPLKLSRNLKLVAACNPYRKHSDDMINRLEKAGLGYHVNADETTDKLGRVPMRQLVYRVQPLPQSMLPLVWDFGQLSNDVEKLYISQMVQRYIRDGQLPDKWFELKDALSNIMLASQKFMRNQKDECSFVSLRDVERTLKVMGWFYTQEELFSEMDKVDESNNESPDESPESDGEKSEKRKSEIITDSSDYASSSDDDRSYPFASSFRFIPRSKGDRRLTRALVLALGVCYHSSLKRREEYRNHIAEEFHYPFELPGGAEQFDREINLCQVVFLHGVKLNENIAQNLALRENFFMMVVCVELRIPLFLVGKPGSSKSLSKNILDHNMQGEASDSKLFKNLKQVQMISFQCSPLATAAGISGTFRQAASLQKGKDLTKYTSVVVLDEVGLAEDSPRMPLKALHPLLEDGCDDGDEFQEHKKVAFIGISNWALDPAKMNRGIMVQRDVPDEKDLEDSAKGICSSDTAVYAEIKPFISKLAKAYLHIFTMACDFKALCGSVQGELKAREFFGLRDFYSLIKLIYAFVDNTRERPNRKQLIYAIKRNFGGLEGLDPVNEFRKYLDELSDEDTNDEGPDISESAMLNDCLKIRREIPGESRYVLLLTENFGALSLLQQKLIENEDVHIVFGSSFPKDQEYIQICRNINRIKVYMETGKTVVLLNLENLYESLYDALNQYYMESGPDRYIDLGLGTHRVKCKVHKDFRLIVVAEKRVVYKEFPIPLINRLEKHFLGMNSILTEEQQELSKKLEKWTTEFSNIPSLQSTVKVQDVFIGYNNDTPPGLLLKAWKTMEKKQEGCTGDSFQKDVLEESKRMLLWSCVPDAILRLQQKKLAYSVEEHQTELANAEDMFRIYFHEQCHESLFEYLNFRIQERAFDGSFIQITTHSKLLSEEDIRFIENHIPELQEKPCLLSLQAFDTEQSFSQQICDFVKSGRQLLIIQCDTGGENANLIECARYCVQREVLKDDFQNQNEHICVVFLVHLSRVCKRPFSGLQTGLWDSVHIDDLRVTTMPPIQTLGSSTIEVLLRASLDAGPSQPTDEIEPRRKALNLFMLLYECVHSAVSSVSDIDEETDRAVRRNNTIFHMITKDKNLERGSPGYGLFHQLLRILTPEESQVHWLSLKAASPENVMKTGTFRASCLKSIEKKIVPLLAKTVAYLDTNENLEIFMKSSESKEDDTSWEYRLWVSVLHRDSLCVSSVREPVVLNTGHGTRLKAAFPFSWIAFEEVESLINISTEQIGKDAAALFSERTIGMIINEEVPGKNDEALSKYIEDFASMSHSLKSDEEKKVVCGAIIQTLNKKEDKGTLCLTEKIVSVHRTYNDMRHRIRTFTDISSVWTGDQESFYMKMSKNQEVVDLMAVLELLNSLEPSAKKLEGDTGKKAWLYEVNKHRLIIEKVLEENTPQRIQRATSIVEDNLLSSIKSVWSKVRVLKLFLEIVCEDNKAERTRHQTCMLLWKTLENNTNFKDIKSLEKLEKFLKQCNKKTMTDFLGKYGKCKHCETPFEAAPPVQLPCKHLICRGSCYSMVIAQPDERRCPVTDCGELIPEEFDENETSEDKREKMEMFFQYQKRCNRFYMHVVSELCFEHSTPPSDDVCRRLLDLITQKTTIPNLNIEIIRTKQFSIFENTVDATPVFRSFLLQLMIRSKMEIVISQLDTFLQKAQEICKMEDGKQHYVELCIILVQCIEDSFHEQSTLLKKDEFQKDRNKELEFAKDTLERAVEDLEKNSSPMEKMRTIAMARFGLKMAAQCVSQKIHNREELSGEDQLLSAAFDLCQKQEISIRKFFLAHICKVYGIDVYRSLQMSGVADFLFDDIEEDLNFECPDYCLALGQTYIKMRDDIGKLMYTRDRNKQTIEMKDASTSGQIQLLLALLREVTFKELISAEERTSRILLIKENLEAILKNREMYLAKKYVDDVIRNALGRHCSEIRIRPQLPTRHQGLLVLIIHLTVVLHSNKTKSQLYPLVALGVNPEEMINSFLPTMPEEDLSQEIIDEIQRQEEMANKYHHSSTWYRCKNGHLYAVGDCGNPTQRGKCYHCGEDIGGEDERMREDNIRQEEGDDRSELGHIHGSAENYMHAISERSLTPSSYAILRLLTHLSMYIGANENPQPISDIVKPPVEELSTFLWNHINNDFDVAAKTLCLNTDELFMMFHKIIHWFLVPEGVCTDVLETGDLPTKCLLNSKEERSKWEGIIHADFIQKILQKLKDQDFLNTCRRDLAKDISIGSDPTLKEIYEEPNNMENGNFSIQHLEMSPVLWQQRTRVSFEHFVKEFHDKTSQDQSTKLKYHVLSRFLQEEDKLCMLRHIPKILAMQKMLLARLNKQITREEAKSITIQGILEQYKQDISCTALRNGIDSFIEAWRFIRQYFPITTSESKTLQGIVERDINMNDCLAIILPDSKSLGLCTRILFEKLLGLQNDFLNECCNHFDKRFYTSEMTVDDITHMHVVNFQREADIFPIILANSNYTYECNGGTRLEYDFESVQKTVQDIYLFGKSTILVYKGFQRIVYRADASFSTKFRTLTDKIKQEPLSQALQSQITREYSDLPELYESIGNLDIVVNFLLTMNDQREPDLNTFMEKTLQMKPISSKTAAQCCTTHHIQALWFTLTLEKTKRLHANGKDAFESIHSSLKMPFSEDIETSLESVITDMSLQKLEALLDQLLECILFRLHQDEDDDETYNYSLRESLEVHMDSPIYAETDLRSLTTADVLKLPEEIRFTHSVETWKCIHQNLISRLQNQ